MIDDTPTHNSEAIPLSAFELELFINGLKTAADHSLGADRINQLPGFHRLSEKDQLLVGQRADQQKADRTLRHLEEEWKRSSFDHLIAPKLATAMKHRSDQSPKNEADRAFYSILRLATERKWETLETFLETAAESGVQVALKQWRREARSSWLSLAWQILCGSAEVAFIAFLLASMQPGFPVIVASVLVLVYSTLSFQIAGIDFKAFVSMCLLYVLSEPQHDAAKEMPVNADRGMSKQQRGLWVRAAGLAISEVIALVALVVKGLF